MSLLKSEFETIRRWMYRNARPIDLARWRFHFEEGPAEAVLVALEAYQNADGGFSHALEADSWNTESAPIQTWCAVEILKEIGCRDKEHKIIKGMLHYLKNCQHTREGCWLAEIPSNNLHPHAPWWTYELENVGDWGYNPTAAFVGFILEYAKEEDSLRQQVSKNLDNIINDYLSKTEIDMHELGCFISLWESCKKTGTMLKKEQEFEKKLAMDVKKNINPNTDEWSEYTSTPSRFFNTLSSPYYKENKKLADYEGSLLIQSRNAEGIWDIPWQWVGYEEEFAVSKNWWKAQRIIENMLYLRNFGLLEK